MKKCTQCNEEKHLDEFYRDKKSDDGHKHKCKKCTYENNERYRKNNREKYIRMRREYYHKNKAKLNKYQREYQARLKECANAYHEVYDRPETIQEFRRKWFNEKM